MQRKEKKLNKYINREISWLKFNLRVLAEASNLKNPILERLKFLSIAANNLDEFFMVRVAGIYNQIKDKVSFLSHDGLTSQKQLERIIIKTKRLLTASNQAWFNLKVDLSKEGILFVSYRDLNKSEKVRLNKIFRENIYPILTPLIVDPSHPFPFVPNKGHFLVMLLNKRNKSKKFFAIILIPQNIERFINISNRVDVKKYLSIEHIISNYVNYLFPGYHLNKYTSVRVIRDSDIEFEEEAEDLILYLEKALKKRRRGRIVKLEIRSNADPLLKKFVYKKLEVTEDEVYEMDSFVGVHQIDQIYNKKNTNLVFKSFNPRQVERLKQFNNDYFATIKAKDFIVHHPYETFDAVIQFLTQAAEDPNVIAIKQTLYRTTSDSPIVKALVLAAEKGKSVTAVVEVKARFDEEKNISLASTLEKAGVQVVYGFVKLKTHAKASLIVRKEKSKLVSYVHLGTGNYHPINAKIYTDLSFFSSDKIICEDVEKFFNYITTYAEPKKLKKLILSPLFLRTKLYSLIDQEIENKLKGKHAEIWIKLNSLVDQAMIDKLYQASNAGVKICLFVRGICCLKPGIKGLSENIIVKSIVGRFLEHSRIYCFANGEIMPSRSNLAFFSSADLMTRNLDRRVELLIPVENSTVHEQVLDQIMLANYKDAENSWFLKSDESYEKIKVTTENNFSAHNYFMKNPSLSGRGSSINLSMPEKLRLVR
ncbi:MAG: RNA degradosome polyphosphate kinase [Candidatus Fonsibacter ubiquis]|jgi:polyphosphate kinase|nr:RNA degradosome polyphosphate kinase [Pseudomonadota bacterium]HRD24357.1 RNA degradosome polyphosphate kinase [Candidatus Fonsibacter ubiquis]